MLGYFIDPCRQRAGRVPGSSARRSHPPCARHRGWLRSLGYPIDVDAVLASASATPAGASAVRRSPPHSCPRGHARDRNDAFDRFIGAGSPAFVPRHGPTPDEVIAIVGKSRRDRVAGPPRADEGRRIIPRLVAAGLTALEVRHTDHEASTEQRYRELAAALRIAASGGSDFHGDSGHRASALGAVTLSGEDFAALESRAVSQRDER